VVQEAFALLMLFVVSSVMLQGDVADKLYILLTGTISIWYTQRYTFALALLLRQPAEMK
jgi:hypothetical protein